MSCLAGAAGPGPRTAAAAPAPDTSLDRAGGGGPARRAPRPRRRRISRVEAFLEEGRGFIRRLESLRPIPPTARQDLDQLEEELLDYFDRVLEAAGPARGENRRRLAALGGNLERAAAGFEIARDALSTGDQARYQAAIDLLLTCCVANDA